MNKSLRVGMLINGYYPRIGGAERILSSLTPILNSMDLEICVLTRRHPGLESFEVVDGIPVYRMPIPGPKMIASLSYSIQALRLLKKLQLDILHVHALTSTARTAVFAKQLWGLPIVTTIHRSGELGDIFQLKNKKFGSRRLSLYMNHIESYIVISRDIDRELSELGIPQEKRFFIPNGVDTNRFIPVSPNRKKEIRASLDLPDSPIVIFVGRLDPEKRVNHLINTWPEIRATNPDVNLLILGTGSVEHNLRKSAKDGIRFEGSVADVVPYLQASDIFVLPSIAEGLSVAALEAQSVGLPVILTDVGGAKDMITHGINGYLIPPDDCIALKGALDSLLGDKIMLSNMGLASRERVVRNYSLSSVASRLRAVYYEQMNKSSGMETTQGIGLSSKS